MRRSKFVEWASRLWLVTLASGIAFCQMVGGAGPSVMSRGGNTAGGRGSEPVDFTFYGGVLGTYMSGLTAPIINSQGEATTTDTAGVAVNVGAYGSQRWRRSSLGLDYRGDYQYYTNNQYFNGSDHALGIEYRHTLNRRWEFAAREAAGTSTRPFGGFTSPSFMNADYLSVPVTEIYNNRIYYLQTTGYAGYRKSARTQFTFSGGGFATYRQSKALVDARSLYASGAVQRRLGRDLAVGASYNYMRFTYPRIFGQSELHGTSIEVERSLGRASSFRLSVGGYRMQTLGTEQFILRPEIAAILGRTTGVRVFDRSNYMAQFAATLTHRRRNTSYNAGYSRGALPGNGIYLTSQSDIASAGLSYTGIRRLSFGLNVAHIEMKSLAQVIPKYSSTNAGGGFGWALGNGLNFTAQADWRRISAGVTIREQTGMFVTGGLVYSSSSLPISLW